jgi:DegV family protein with EDD domain
MQIVTDSGTDLTPSQLQALNIRQLPLKLTISGKTYSSGVDLNPDQFYDLIENTEDMPITSVPSPGDFIEIYKDLVKTDPEILSIHMSSGLSGTFNAARMASTMVEGADVTLVDTLNLSGGSGWQVEAAAKAAKQGWTMERILKMINQIRLATHTIYTLPDLKYLIAGGRISHLKGLLASLLGIKPLIGVDPETGKYTEMGKSRSFFKAIEAIPDTITKMHAPGTELRVQIGHAGNPSGAERLKAAMEKVFKCEWLPDISIGPALGAHTGRGLVGVIYAAKSALPAMP